MASREAGNIPRIAGLACWTAAICRLAKGIKQPAGRRLSISPAARGLFPRSWVRRRNGLVLACRAPRAPIGDVVTAGNFTKTRSISSDQQQT